MSTSDLAYLIAGIALILILFAFELGSAFGGKREKQYWLEGQRDMLHTPRSRSCAKLSAAIREECRSLPQIYHPRPAARAAVQRKPMKRTDKRSPDYPSFFLGGEAICFSSRGFSPTGELKLWYAFSAVWTDLQSPSKPAPGEGVRWLFRQVICA